MSNLQYLDRKITRTPDKNMIDIIEIEEIIVRNIGTEKK